MGKLIKVSMLVVLISILAIGAFQVLAGFGVLPVPGATPNVGWNTSPTTFLWDGGGAQPNVGWNTKEAALTFPGAHPMIGWNT